MTRVRIDASNPVVEAGLRTLLEEKVGFQAMKSGEIADVLLSDRQFDEIDNDPPPLPVVLLTHQSASSMLRQGARGVLPPNSSPIEIRAALEAAAAGLLVLPAQEAESWPAAQLPMSDTTLTAREREVLRLLAEGVGNKEIAWRLSITEHTVKFHVSSLMSKLNAGSRTEAVTQGIRRGYVAL
ncbi:helix-turn-helix transcriptional regulator [Bryobacter aggregatus]|uniref:helix-turn-helix transcriptional regulator n=1 Tax=Bryobacter aggregatus TaxID=360054 RepID=UPI0005649782|nr:response regulator transcription factor [Bryobacter aggregatus]